MNAFSELNAQDSAHLAEFGRNLWKAGDRAYSNLHKCNGTILRIDAQSRVWFHEDGRPTDYCTQHGFADLRPTTNSGGYIAPELKGRAADLSILLQPLNAINPVLDSRYLVKGWLDRGAFSVVYGESNVGKTFFALDLSMHVAAARDWHGNRIPGNTNYAGPVVYVAGEGGAGINNRIEAIRRERAHLMRYTEENGDFMLLPTALDLCESNDAAALVAALDDLPAPPSLIVIDTLARAFGGGDENTAKDMGAFIRNIDAIRAETGAHVMVIHHSGKDTSKGARGSGSLRAAVDTEIELTRDGTVILAETKKQRDMPTGNVFAYTLRSVLIGQDEDGDDITSAVVEAAEAPEKRKPRLRGQALIAMNAFNEALANHGEFKKGQPFPEDRQCVALERWREYCDRHDLSSGEGESSNRAAFHKNKTNLQERGLVRVQDGYVWGCA
ncbi:helicase RepA family protein [Seohaeicola saemankumensis]|uniref:Helicase RepA family protein n=1 Tax=Seohaeicola saemankumensis TaxID=481181 RepID=A0ABW3T9I8_9RHOB